MGTNCTPLITDLSLHFYDADLIADLIHRKEHHSARSFDLSLSFIDQDQVLL